MTTSLVFPSLNGQLFPVKRPVTASNVASGNDSGREVRTAIYGNIWEWEIGFDGLSSDAALYAGLGAQTLQAIVALYLQCQGAFGTFLYTDPTDSVATAQGLGTGDGATTGFKFRRAIGGAYDNVGKVTSVSAVYLNGVAQPSGWSLVAPNVLSFATAPAAGVAVTASFSYQFVCRFMDDNIELTQIMNHLWQGKSVKFRSVLA